MTVHWATEGTRGPPPTVQDKAASHSPLVRPALSHVPVAFGSHVGVAGFHLSLTSTDASGSNTLSDAEANMTVPDLRELATTPNTRQLVARFGELEGLGKPGDFVKKTLRVLRTQTFSPWRAEEGDVGLSVGEAQSRRGPGGQNSVSWGRCEPGLPSPRCCRRRWKVPPTVPTPAT